MQQLSFDFANFTAEEKPLHQHQSLLERFAERINPARVSANYKPYSYARIAGFLAGLTYAEREQLFYECEKATCGFGRYFGWRIKNKKV